MTGFARSLVAKLFGEAAMEPQSSGRNVTGADSRTPEPSGDTPIETHAEDRFSRWRFAERIAQIIGSRTDNSSLVIGIYGPWGDGKTSVLNMLKEALREQNNTTFVSFNPWHFENNKQLIQAFFATLSNALGTTLFTRKEQVGDVLKTYGNLVGIGGFGGVAEFGEKLSDVSIDTLKDRVSEALIKSGRRIVVTIDDIDRLDRTEIHSILRLVKLSAGFANTTYVIACDDVVVAESLGERYAAGDEESGRQFLEKIVQVPLHLPNAEEFDLRSMLLDGVNGTLDASGVDLDESAGERFVIDFDSGVLPSIRTPRQVKRFLNAIQFAVPLLKGEVDMVDCLLLEGLRLSYPRLYLSIRSHPEVYLGTNLSDPFDKDESIKKASKQQIDDALKDLDDVERSSAFALLKVLFPRIETIYGNNNFGDSWDQKWTADRRLSSETYFRRFFQYAVPMRDISDSDMQKFVASVRDGGNVDSFFDQIHERRAWSKFLDKISISDFVDDASKQRFAIALASRIDTIPQDAKGILEIASSSSRAIRWIATLVLQIADRGQRRRVAKEVLLTTPSLAPALQIFDWMMRLSGEIPGTSLEEVERKGIGIDLAVRIEEEFARRPDFSSYGLQLADLLLFGATHKNDVLPPFVMQQVQQDPRQLFSLLKGFTKNRRYVISGSSPPEFERDSYQNIARVIDPNLLVQELRKVFSDRFEGRSVESCSEFFGDERLACTFITILENIRQRDAEKQKGDRPK